MEVFVYNAAKPRETIEEFNTRVAQLCLDNPVVNISAEAVGPSLVISLSMADDLDVDLAPTLMPVVLPIEGHDAELEEHITELIDRINESHSDEDARIPIGTKIAFRSDIPAEGWAVVTVMTGMVEGESDDD